MYFLETHLHTRGGSGCARASARNAVRIYSKNGYNGIVVTNHFNRKILDSYFRFTPENKKIERYLKGYYNLKRNAEHKNIDVFFGVELALTENYYRPNFKNGEEILIYGITPEEFKEYGRNLVEKSLEELKLTAEKNNWVLIQAHPFRKNSARVPIEYIDGVEIKNTHPGHPEGNAACISYAKAHNLLGLCGSDFHYKGAEGSGILLQHAPKDEKELAELIKNGCFTIKERKGFILK